MNDHTPNPPHSAPASSLPYEVPDTPASDEDGTIRNDLEHFHNPFSQYLTERQQLAVELLLAGERDGKVAEKVGVGRTTLWRWRKEWHFRHALAAGRELALSAAVDRLRGLVPTAVDRLQEQIEEGNTLAPYRLLRLVRVDRTAQSENAE